MRETVDDRLRSRGAGIVGCSAEVAPLLAMLDAVDGPVVAVVHGPGGVGKTALLREVERLAGGRNRVTHAFHRLGSGECDRPIHVLTGVFLPGR